NRSDSIHLRRWKTTLRLWDKFNIQIVGNRCRVATGSSGQNIDSHLIRQRTVQASFLSLLIS
ncbi:hypothetical protein BLOT_004392, partial [Blomia tropicalis]